MLIDPLNSARVGISVLGVFPFFIANFEVDDQVKSLIFQSTRKNFKDRQTDQQPDIPSYRSSSQSLKMKKNSCEDRKNKSDISPIERARKSPKLCTT